MSDGEFGLMSVPAFLFLLMQLLPSNGIKPQKGRIFMILIFGLAAIDEG